MVGTRKSKRVLKNLKRDAQTKIPKRKKGKESVNENQDEQNAIDSIKMYTEIMKMTMTKRKTKERPLTKSAQVYKEIMKLNNITKKSKKGKKVIKGIKNGLKFDHVVHIENDTEVISIPEFPDIKLKMIKGGKHPYMCPKCDMGFWTKNEYDDHAIVHVLKKTKPTAKRFRCELCSKEFSKLCDVERHRRVHTGEKPCICNICNRRFQQAHNLSKHLFTHLNFKPFICEHCNKHFGRNDVLRRHILTHSENKPIKCSVCSKGFIRFTQLMTHMRKKHPEEPFDEFTENTIVID